MKTIAQQLNVKEFPFIIKNSQGDEIYYEYSKGYWAKREYNSKGNQIYFEDSDGYWEKSEYDAKGSLIYSKDSDGSWFKSEFDAEGNIIYLEDSDGFIEDNRNVPEYTMEELVEKIGHFKLKTKQIGRAHV